VAWGWVQKILSLPNTSRVTQNGLYDIQWLWRKAGIHPRGDSDHDTMLMSHALYPEMPKGLGFLGSVYSDESAWKELRKSAKREDA